MAMVTPDTELYLLKCPITIDNSNQLTFENVEAQLDYFMSLEKVHAEDFTYQRKDNTIRYPDNVDNFYGYNYCIYKNSHYTDKWFFAFIQSMKYVNDNMTEIKIKTDVFQTWQFDLNYKQSFVIREHTNDDSFGANLEPEDLETGDLTCTVSNLTDDLFEYCVVLCSTHDPQTMEGNGGGLNGNVFQGYKMYMYHPVMSSLRPIIQRFQQSGYADYIVGMFMYPVRLCTNSSTFNDGQEITGGLQSLTFNKTIPNILNYYEPRNRKLLQYPYQYCTIDNSSGDSMLFKYEYFRENIYTPGVIPQMHFSITALASLSSSWFISATNYNIEEYHQSSGILKNMITGGKYPQCGWQNDSYTNWLVQQSKNLENQKGYAIMNKMKAEAEVAGKTEEIAFNAGRFGAIFLSNLLPMDNPLEAAAEDAIALYKAQIDNTKGFDLEIGKIQAQKYEHSFENAKPAGQLNVGDVIFAWNKLQPQLYRYTIRKYYAEKIDKYFDMFGYATNKMKIPNITGRENWNYLKTARINITGNIPQTDLQEIKSMFDNGVTLWHNPDTFLDYSQSNEILEV